jgi:hypothetical protein
MIRNPLMDRNERGRLSKKQAIGKVSRTPDLSEFKE